MTVAPGSPEELAERQAASLKTQAPSREAAAFQRRRRRVESALRDALKALADEAASDISRTRGVEWVLNNEYLIESTLKQVRTSASSGFLRELPVLASEEGPEIRACRIASDILQECCSRIDLDWISRYLQAYQGYSPLTIGEIWILPTILQFRILEVLSQVIPSLRVSVDREGDRLSRAGEEADRCASDCVKSLHTLAAQDWKDFFESVSLVEGVLAEDPAQVYRSMDFKTRNRYRGCVERLARQARCEEVFVARMAVALAGESEDPKGAPGHVGYYLLGPGRGLLRSRTGCSATPVQRLRERLSRRSTSLYLGTIALLAVIVIVVGLAALLAAGVDVPQAIAFVILAIVPATDISTVALNFFLSLRLEPCVLPKLDFSAGIPDDCATLVVMPSLLTRRSEADALLRRLEVHHAGNQDARLWFALLTDFGDAPCEHMPSDEPLLERVRQGIGRLNSLCVDRSPFLLLHRPRRWNPGQECWMGWERKRGKLEELNRLLAGDPDTDLTVAAGDFSALPAIRFVISADADTLIPPAVAPRLVGTLAHPLNQARFDSRGRVVSGYTVLQPRIVVDPESAAATRFSGIFAGEMGLDLYTNAVSDVYQDLFGEGTYVGKGIYDRQAFQKSLDNRIPVNTVLSHDLLEGVHGRAGLVSDIVFLEDYPCNVLALMRRLHRWVRGDWQLLPWLKGRVPSRDGESLPNRLSALSRWKLIDNLRRSLLAPNLLVLFLAGWLWFPGPAWLWTLLGLTALAMPLAFSALLGARRMARDGPSMLPALTGTGHSLRIELFRLAAALAFLPYEAVVTCDAIVRTLVRILFTRRNLLEWVTAAHASRQWNGLNGSGAFWRRMWIAPLFAAAALTVLLLRPSAIPVAAGFLLLWMASPQIGHWTAGRKEERRRSLSARDQRQLRLLARRTWHFFEHFAGQEDNWLIPDNHQETPGGHTAHHTSPTNIGMMLLATLSAYEFGYITSYDFEARLDNAFSSLRRLDRYRGHFLNWYDTRSLHPLIPKYVSAVDSGNLAAALLTVREGCLSMLTDPLLRAPRLTSGILDALALLRECVENLDFGQSVQETRRLSADLAHLSGRLEKIGDQSDLSWVQGIFELCETDLPACQQGLAVLAEASVETTTASGLSDLRVFATLFEQALTQLRVQIELLAPWLPLLGSPPSFYSRLKDQDPASLAWKGLLEQLSSLPPLCELPDYCRSALRRLDALKVPTPGPEGEALSEATHVRNFNRRLADALRTGMESSRLLIEELRLRADEANRLFEEMDFSFLFDNSRQVFHIGFNLSSGTLDPNCYDLLASEARLASFIAIAKGDLPPSHWLHLKRPFFLQAGTRGLLSWGGTMFEYLMPSLMMKSPAQTLLTDACRSAVQMQIDFADRQGIPWGVSESGYHEFDANHRYQYRAFGVPPLGLAMGIGDRLVVASYASMLALRFRPRDVIRNLRRLLELGMEGRYGLFEALDYGNPREGVPRRAELVHSYMAHHQGMILAALANALADSVLVRRFHADPRIESAEPLVYERIPQAVVPYRPLRTRPAGASSRADPYGPWKVDAQAAPKQAHLVSNGNLSAIVRSDGSTALRLRDCLLTRSSSDPAAAGGGWLYLRDMDSQHTPLWCAGTSPIAAEGHCEVLFNPHGAEFRRLSERILSDLQVAVSSEADLLVARVKLHNETNRTRRISITSYAEVALMPEREAIRHPAFDKLFIESVCDPELKALLFRRRPRSPTDEHPRLGQALVCLSGTLSRTGWETDRAKFLGRSGSLSAPDALAGEGRLTGTAGYTLDPVAVLQGEVRLPPYGYAEVAFLTAAGKTFEDVRDAIAACQTSASVDRVFEQAALDAGKDLERLSISSREAERIQKLFSAILFPRVALRGPSAALRANGLAQSGLWRFGISGDNPIVLVRLDSRKDDAMVVPLLKAHAFMLRRHFRVDLVILDQQPGGYARPLADRSRTILERLGLRAGSGFFLLASDQVDADARQLLESAARVFLVAPHGLENLENALRESDGPPLPAFAPMPSSPLRDEGTPLLPRPQRLVFDNGLGGFSRDGREYVIQLPPHERTPAPWVNVIANPDFGCVVSESGGGFTWAGNSAENRLTPWANDPVLDSPGEALYLREEETGAVWSATPSPRPAPTSYRVRHGAGYSVFRHRANGLDVTLTISVDPRAPVKISELRIRNLWDRNRRLTATCWNDWVLGGAREQTAPFVVPGFESEVGALTARNPFHAAGGDPVAFLSSDRPPHGYTCDRREFLGSHGDPSRPAALWRSGLSESDGVGRDCCAALQTHISLDPHETIRTHFILGQGESRDEALALIRRFRDPAQVETSRRASKDFWDDQLGKSTIRTPDPAMDILWNRWLLYQTISCRLWGRSGLYQSSGAFGFRDQLQDVLALCWSAPELARRHILSAASRQFEEGDVLHWWHPPTARGIRSRCSDDLLWLPFAVAHYVEAAGDDSILDESVSFLAGRPLNDEEADRYGEFEAGEQASLLEHCLRALRKSRSLGPQGLPLIGTCDWNDGMNRVGAQGKGESVWLGWFQIDVLNRFAEICRQRGRNQEADAFAARVEEQKEALTDNGWDGHWFRRAYFDDGTPLGSSQSDECRIDLIAQAWPVLSRAADPGRAIQAMDSAERHLVKESLRMILLLAPPFDRTRQDPGYIRAYPPGVRENGGQYTHAAIWHVWALTELGKGNRAGELLRWLNPIHRSAGREDALGYGVEPYAVAGDIYSRPPHEGRGGWTWYTGAAAWLHRLGMEQILGIRVRGDKLEIRPCIPESWEGYQVTLRRGRTRYEIEVENPHGAERGVEQIIVDGKEQAPGEVRLLDDSGGHRIRVIMAPPAAFSEGEAEGSLQDADLRLRASPR